MTEVAVIVGYALRESMRRKVFLIVLLLSVAFLALYGVGVWRAFTDTASFVPPDQLGLDPTVVTGATVLGLAMFATLFLGTVLAIFLTLGVVRGDAERGLLQPLVVRQVGDGFQLIAGERRLRAAREAGLGEVPVHLVAFDDQQVFEAALVENIQRSDLNPIEKAQGFKDYLDRFGLTQEQLGAKLGLDRIFHGRNAQLRHVASVRLK